MLTEKLENLKHYHELCRDSAEKRGEQEKTKPKKEMNLEIIGEAYQSQKFHDDAILLIEALINTIQKIEKG